ncbi:MAG: MFS transporter [Gammaproteobacteria bacterium]|nr:MFS transporter [Gammaproteobacteria bacterium]
MTNKSNRLLIIGLFLVITIDTMGIGFVWPLFGPLFTGKTTTLFNSAVSMEWRNILYGITIGIANLTAFFASPILGDLSDRLGRRKILLFCLFGTSIGMGISALGIIFSQVFLLIFSRAWLGAIAGGQVIAQAAMIDISNPGNKSTRLGIISAANNIGFIFGPIISVLLIDSTIVSWFSFTTPFYFAAILALVSAIFLLKVFKENNKISAPLTQKPAKKTLVFVRAFTNKQIRMTALIYLALQIGWALYLQTNFLSLIQKFNYSSRHLGYFLAWLGIIFCFNLLVVVRLLTQTIALKKIIYSTLTIAAICCFVVAFYNTEIGIWLGIIPMATAIALGSNALLTNLSNIAEKNEQGWMMGVGNSLAALAWAITPPIVGIILILGFSLPLFIAGVLFFLGTIIWIASPSARNDGKNRI